MQGSTQGRVLRLIDGIYAAASSFERWPATLEMMADTFGAQDASLGSMAPHSLPWIFAPRTDPAFMASYPQYHAANTVWHGIVAHGTGAAVTDDMVMSRRHRAQSVFHNEWFKPQGYATKLGGMVLAEQGWKTVLTLPGKHRFGPGQVQLFRILSPHIARAVQINIRLAQGALSSEVTARLLCEMTTAALVVDADCRVLFANQAAEALFLPGHGLRLTRSVLDAERPDEAAALTRLVGQCARGGLQDAGGVVTLNGTGSRARQLLVAPLRRNVSLLAPGVPAALIIETRADAPQRTALQLQSLYGLTPAEARFALEIAKGDGKHAAAARSGITYSTARSHLSHIFHKTGVRRQAELVRLVLGEGAGR